MLTYQARFLHAYNIASGNIFVGDDQPRPLRAHGNQRSLEFRDDVFGCFNMVFGRNDSETIVKLTNS